MELKKSEKRLLMILGLAVSVFLIDQLVLKPKGQKSNQNTHPVQAASGNQVAAVQSPPLRGQQFDTWGRDPFTPVSTPRRGSVSSSASVSTQKSDTTQLALKGIVWKEGKAFALIGEHVIGEGDEEQGIKVEKIEGMEVLCRQGTRMFTLYWRESP